MTALSWIFGGKKKEEKPVTVTVEAIEVGSDEDYAIIQTSSSRMGGIYPQMPPSPYPPAPYIPLPYTMLPPRQNQQPVGNSTRTAVQNQLEGVPFVLSPALDQSSTQNHDQELENLRRAVFQIAADINDSVYEYDFKFEHSIIREASIAYNDN